MRKIERQKLFLSEKTIDDLRVMVLNSGQMTNEQFNKWVDDYIELIFPLECPHDSTRITYMVIGEGVYRRYHRKRVCAACGYVLAIL